MAVSHDGRRALAGCVDHSVRLFDLPGGAELRRFAGHEAEVTAVAFAPDGRYAVIGAGDGEVRVWSLPP